MKKNKILAAAAVMLTGLGLSQSASATPAFARQMSMNCLSCHNQSIPMLNSFGRQFKLSGYTMVSGAGSMITGGNLGTNVPLAINAGVGAKSTYTSSDVTGARTELAVPAGAAIMIGGRFAENAGANVLFNGDGIVHLQAAFAKPMGDGHASIAYYGTLGHGPFIATESHNTGLHKELQMIDSSDRANAAQFVGMGLGKGPATGVTATYGGSGLKASVGLWSLGFNTTFWNGGVDTDGGMGSLFRLTYDTSAFGWDFGVGAFGVSGSHVGSTDLLFENTKVATGGWIVPGDVNTHEVTASGFDLQAQGNIAGIDTQIILTRVGNYEFLLREENGTLSPMPNGQTVAANMMDRDIAATSLQIQAMLNPAWGLRLGYMNIKDARATKTVGPQTYVEQTGTTNTVGVNYNYADNVRFSLERSSYKPDTGTTDTQTLLTSIIAF